MVVLILKFIPNKMSRRYEAKGTLQNNLIKILLKKKTYNSRDHLSFPTIQCSILMINNKATSCVRLILMGIFRDHFFSVQFSSGLYRNNALIIIIIIQLGI